MTFMNSAPRFLVTRLPDSFVIVLGCLISCVAAASEVELTLKVVDAETNRPVASRVVLQSEDGQYFFFESIDSSGTSERYEKRNWNNHNAAEFYTTLSAHPARSTLPTGTYHLTVFRGKEYHAHSERLQLDEETSLTVTLKRWINLADRGWYSGDTHLHRTIEELKTVLLAEDLNVAFPLTHWVTHSDTLPSAGDKNQQTKLPDGLVEVDERHVIWPLNTEYEIFRVANQPHSLGALFILGQEEPLTKPVPPWRPMIESANQGELPVLFDMDKLDWPFAMVLPTLVPESLYELANNHMWRTEFGFRNWNTAAPREMFPPYGRKIGGEREWIDYTMGMYYALLNCGFRLPPSAGTANGVHPVPAGFGRVYVYQPEGFDYSEWKKGLQAGRSFVTTGPMVFATADGHPPGHHFSWSTDSDPQKQQPSIPLSIEVCSEKPVLYGEVLINGRPEHLLRGQNQQLPNGSFRSLIELPIEPIRSGWFAIRFWEQREQGRIRFAHTAPWYVSVNDEPVRPLEHERAYLVRRMEEEIARSESVLPADALAEYRQALEFYQSLPVVDDSLSVKKTSRPFKDEADRNRWLKTMVLDHHFSATEIRQATGMTIEEAQEAVEELDSDQPLQAVVKIRPFPGGRHPRSGFLEGAIDPQRETKVSIFPPWENGGYVVVDVPEAIFSNLGLTYLAHTHIPTIWDEQQKQLPQLEWIETDGELLSERTLPNGITFSSSVAKEDTGTRIKISLTNRTENPLTGMRVQVCTMLSAAVGFDRQQPLESIERESMIAVRSSTGNRWILTDWRPNHRVWSNPPVPCIHSDPKFPDCPPGETVSVEGGLWFYEGDDVDLEMDRLSERMESTASSSAGN
ncbi:hypothetical protein KOR42_42330 [Thalassoglobus neptunius]|uniref:Secreted protein n=1 Tax=Thalassoglobus neptunius TaxID=1938619 RepID=A0A5C5W814_9PLAN|nr:hypothetical protein [Thalassoglobus neptunius]TWT47036.1 hypothetical protein KOR42_42330 [Thalassoglobus neptunius]